MQWTYYAYAADGRVLFRTTVGATSPHVAQYLGGLERLAAVDAAETGRLLLTERVVPDDGWWTPPYQPANSSATRDHR